MVDLKTSHNAEHMSDLGREGIDAASLRKEFREAADLRGGLIACGEKCLAGGRLSEARDAFAAAARLHGAAEGFEGAGRPYTTEEEAIVRAVDEAKAAGRMPSEEALAEYAKTLVAAGRTEMPTALTRGGLSLPVNVSSLPEYFRAWIQDTSAGTLTDELFNLALAATEVYESCYADDIRALLLQEGISAYRRKVLELALDAKEF